MRFAQGLALGGEWSGAALLAAESVPEVAALMAMPRRQAERINALTVATAHG